MPERDEDRAYEAAKDKEIVNDPNFHDDLAVSGLIFQGSQLRTDDLRRLIKALQKELWGRATR